MKGQEKVEEEDEDSGTDTDRGRVTRILRRSITLKQLDHKISTVKKVNIHTTKWIEAGDIIMLLLLDLAIGVFFSTYLTDAVPNLYELVHGKIELLLELVLQILDWLSGAPAGLKLNASLNSLLGRFFSYNLHLWRNYIKILEPVLKLLLSAVIYSGMYAGFTMQVALIKDIVSITTFHVYCLYIYATRLFNIELNALKSLGHLFFGRKWNPLRNRIDSVHLNRSEMFLSSLAFTIAVFLAPTVLIYYVVFLSLRLPILLVESFLKFIIDMTNCTEVVTLTLVLFNSSMIPYHTYLYPKRVGKFDKHRPFSSGDFNELPIIHYEERRRAIYKMKLPNFGRGIKEIVVRILKSQVITH